MSKFIFVYGTLKRGYANCIPFLRGQKFVCEAKTEPIYRLFDNGSYPGMTVDYKNGYAVTGEIWNVEDSVIDRLDHLEGVPFLYLRLHLNIKEWQGNVVQGYIYQRDVSMWRECKNGVWPYVPVKRLNPISELLNKHNVSYSKLYSEKRKGYRRYKWFRSDTYDAKTFKLIQAKAQNVYKDKLIKISNLVTARTYGGYSNSLVILVKE